MSANIAKREVFTPLAFTVPAYVAAIAGAEFVVARVGVVPGLICHALILLALLEHYAWQHLAPYRRALPVLALAPLLRILSLAMPIAAVPRLYWYVLIGLPLWAGVFLASRLLDFTWAGLGLGHSPWRPQLLIALSGPPLSLAAYLLVRPRPLISVFDGPHLLVGAIILTFFAACTEEVLFRGLLQHVLTDIFPRSGVLWSASLFASMYIGSLSVRYVLFMGLVGLFFGWCVRQTGSLWGVILAHSGLIVGLVCVWPFHHP